MSRTGPLPPSDLVPSATDLQRAIASVVGVTGAEVSQADNGRDRLRITLAPGEDPEAVAWTVAATLRERFGIALDPAAITARAIEPQAEEPVRVIHPERPDGVAGTDPHQGDGRPAGNGRHENTDPHQDAPTGATGADDDLAAAARAALADGDPASGHHSGGRNRAAIRELIARPVGDDLDVTATLRLSGRDASGRARGLRTRRGRWRAIAEATIAALGGLTGGRVRGNVDHVTVLTFADLAHVSVSVTLLTERGEETFLGAALVRDDPDRAVMRAALDAVNRRVEPWLDEFGTVSEAG